MKAALPVFNFLASAYNTVQHERSIIEVIFFPNSNAVVFALNGEGCALNGANAGNMELLEARRPLARAYMSASDTCLA
jgi:DNA relaxase NicK